MLSFSRLHFFIINHMVVKRNLSFLYFICFQTKRYPTSPIELIGYQHTYYSTSTFAPDLNSTSIVIKNYSQSESKYFNSSLYLKSSSCFFSRRFHSLLVTLISSSLNSISSPMFPAP